MKKLTNNSKGVATIWIVVIAVLITALVVGGGVYYWQKLTAKKKAEETPTGEEIPSGEETPEGEETVDEYAGWSTYTNDVYNYEFKYPKDAVISEAKISDFSLSGEDVKQGITFQEVYDKYTGKICLFLTYQTGYINISAPVNEGFKYVLCGRTGVGACDTKEKSEELVIDGEKYTAEGFEEICQTSNSAPLSSHNETMAVTLDDKTRIEYGSSSDPTKTFADYLKIRDEILKIVQSYKTL